jgi:hypothetical protein
MNGTIFVAFCFVFGLTIWGRRLREEAFRALPTEQKIKVTEKVANYSSTEMIPFAALLLVLLGVLLFRPEWLRAGAAVCLTLIVVLVGMFHVRAHRRFRELGLPAAFLSQYEKSRIVTYSALAVPIGTIVWILYL